MKSPIMSRIVGFKLTRSLNLDVNLVFCPESAAVTLQTVNLLSLL